MLYSKQKDKRVVIFIMGSKSIRYKLSNMLFLRVLILPFAILSRAYQKKFFRYTEHSACIRKFKDRHKNERCFIIGNGPSLSPEDLDKLKNEKTFAANKIYYIYDRTDWRPTYYISVDLDVCISEKDNIHKYADGEKFIAIQAKKHLGEAAGIHYFYSHTQYHVYKNRVKTGFSDDASNFVFCGRTVTFSAIQLAAYMGFKEIYLLGVDHNYSRKVDKEGNVTKDETVKDYFQGSPNDPIAVQYTDVMTNAYSIAREYCDAHGIKIYNATRGGKLEVFERVDFDKIVIQPENVAPNLCALI